MSLCWRDASELETLLELVFYDYKGNAFHYRKYTKYRKV